MKRLPFNKKTGLFISVLVVYAAPYLFFVVGVGGFLMSAIFSSSGRYALVEPYLALSKYSAQKSTGGFSLYSSVPLVGSFHNVHVEASVFLERSAEALQSANRVAGHVGVLKAHIVDGKHAPLRDVSGALAAELDGFLRDISFIDGIYLQGNKLAQKIVPSKIISVLNGDTVGIAREGASLLPRVVGVGESKTYLLLFQNSNELRPTGGFIGSLGLVRFRNGVFQGIETLDVYDADGQLRGYVAPPPPIEKYLGEAVWYLRDSNWDPDFPKSAARAAWFLDKELGEEVDGVVAINVDALERVLSIVGPVSLPGHGLVVDESSVARTLDDAIHRDFSPGSRVKVDLLTSLQSELSRRVEESDPQELARLSMLGLELLKDKHIQLFSLDPAVQSAILARGWGGSLLPEAPCARCEHTWLSVNEANLGVNKVNDFISRRVEHQMVVSEDGVAHTVSLTLRNNGTQDPYDAYVRLLTTPDAVFDEEGLELSPKQDRAEAGVFVSIPPGGVRGVAFSYTTPRNDTGAKSLYYAYVPQSGLAPFPVNVSIARELTQQAVLGYTTGSSDQGVRVFNF